MTNAIEIVRLLAERDPVTDDGYGSARCALCPASDIINGDLDVPTHHDQNCPWRLAREYIANPPSISARLERAFARVERLKVGHLPDGHYLSRHGEPDGG